MKAVRLIWRRLGKEHGEALGFRLNPPEVVEKHLQDKLRSSNHSAAWQLGDDLLVEQPRISRCYGLDSRIYHIPSRHWTIIEKMQMPPSLGDEWSWYVHIADIQADRARDCWVMTDHFCDIVISPNNRTHSVLDLDDLAEAVELGLIDSATMLGILRHTQELVNLVRSGHFPPPQVLDARRQLDLRG
jgi:hypothetical protein